MCLAVPFKIIKIDGNDGIGEYGGLNKNIRLDFIDAPKIGDYVMVHAGFAIERLDEEQAKLDIEAWKELEDALNSEDEK